MAGQSQSTARSELEAEARMLLERLQRSLLLARNDQLALVQSASTGNYRFVDTAVPEPDGLLGWCDDSTTLEQIKTYMIGEVRPAATLRASARRPS